MQFIKALLIKQNEKDLTRLFDVVYENNYWGNGSGSGSDELLCADYVRFLQDFFIKHKISSVTDAGCGDWQFSKNIRFDGMIYRGFDVSSFVIAANSAKYAKENVSFELYDGDFSKLASADLLICKDVLQHLPNAKVHEFIANLPRFKYALITNDIGSYKTNQDILPTEYRNLDLRLAPFNLKCEKVFEIQEGFQSSGTESKSVFLWSNQIA